MPTSSLILSKFHGHKNSSTKAAAKLDSETCPILSLDVAKFANGETKILTAGADNIIRIWKLNSNYANHENIEKFSTFINEGYRQLAMSPLESKTASPTAGSSSKTGSVENPSSGDSGSKSNPKPENPQKKALRNFKNKITNHECFTTNWFTFLAELVRHEKSVNCAKYSPNKKLIASASDDNNVIIWKETDRPVGMFGFGSSSSSSGPFGNPNYDSNSKEDDKAPKAQEYWQANRVCTGHSQDAIACCWSGDQFLYTCGIDHKVQGFKIELDDNGLLKVTKIFSQENENAKYIQGLVATLDGHLGIAFSSDGYMTYYNKNKRIKSTQDNRKMFCVDNMHPSMFRKADFSPDGLVLATAGGCIGWGF